MNSETRVNSQLYRDAGNKAVSQQERKAASAIVSERNHHVEHAPPPVTVSQLGATFSRARMEEREKRIKAFEARRNDNSVAQQAPPPDLLDLIRANKSSLSLLHRIVTNLLVNQTNAVELEKFKKLNLTSKALNELVETHSFVLLVLEKIGFVKQAKEEGKQNTLFCTNVNFGFCTEIKTIFNS